MKKILVILVLIGCSSLLAQKVKVKKNRLFINKKEVGYYYKDKSMRKPDSKYTILDSKKDTVIVVGYRVIPSLLDSLDNPYRYEFLRIPKYDITISYPISFKYYFSKKKIVRHFMGERLFDEKLVLNEVVAENFKNKNPKLTEEILNSLEQEKKENQNKDFIIEKLQGNPIIFLKEVNSTRKTLSNTYPSGIFYFDTYDIVQKNDHNDKIIIGKVVFKIPYESNTSLSNMDKKSTTIKKYEDMEMFFYNSKGGRVAYLGRIPFGVFKTYHNYTKEQGGGTKGHGLFTRGEGYEIRAEKVINRLILDNKL